MARFPWALPLATLLLAATPALPVRAGTLGEAVSPSTGEHLQLAKELKRVGAIFYGAWWCSHCFHQKNLFGTEAGQQLPYVECDKNDEGRDRRARAHARRGHAAKESSGARSVIVRR
jgi:hypothetical protein